MPTLTVQFRGQMVTCGARRMPDRVDAPGNRCYRIVTVGDFLVRFSRELWDFLRGTNLGARRCAQIALGQRSDIAVFVHQTMPPSTDGQRRADLSEDSCHLFPKAPGASHFLRPIAGRGGNAGIAAKIRCANKRKAPAVGRRLEMPVDDPGASSPREGSICCGDDVGARREESSGERPACLSYSASASAQPRSDSP